jgi:hypothetical protein
MNLAWSVSGFSVDPDKLLLSIQTRFSFELQTRFNPQKQFHSKEATEDSNTHHNPHPHALQITFNRLSTAIQVEKASSEQI